MVGLNLNPTNPDVAGGGVTGWYPGGIITPDPFGVPVFGAPVRELLLYPYISRLDSPNSSGVEMESYSKFCGVL